MEDLVAVGVADPGDERLVLEQVLRARPGDGGSARARHRASAMDRLRRGPARHRSRPRAGRRRPGGRRPCPSGSDRGSGSRPASSSAGIHVVLRVHFAASRGGAARPPNPRTNAVFVGSGAPGAASWNRPVSIGLKTIRSRSKRATRYFPRRRSSTSGCPTSAFSSAGVPRTASGPGASTEVIGTARQGPRGRPRKRRPGRAIPARSADCSRVKRCARLSRP